MENNIPYIKQERRTELCQWLPSDHPGMPQTTGELNFIITNLIKDYMQVKGLSYQTINDIMGAIEGAKLEFYRRIATPYEETKIKENGDVY